MDKNSLQINIPKNLIPIFEQIQSKVDESDLDGKGLKVGSAHITLRYGIETTDVDLIKNTLHKFFPFYIKFGTTSSFPVTKHSEGTAPLIVTIISPQLIALNKFIDSKLPVTKANFDYYPHMTIAYIKPNSVDKYKGLNPLSGMEFITKELTLVHKDNSEVTIHM